MSYYAVIFTSKRNDTDQVGYADMAKKIFESAKLQSGFLGVDSARGSDGVGITVSYWESLESIKAWKNDEEHIEAQKLGRSKWYENFTVRICKVEREYGLESRG